MFLSFFEIKKKSTITLSNSIDTKRISDPRHTPDADEGFASSSSIEEDQISEVIRRKRSSYQLQNNVEKRSTLDFKSSPIDAGRKILEEKISMAPVEAILWTFSFIWVFFQLYTDGNSSFNNSIIAGNTLAY